MKFKYRKSMKLTYRQQGYVFFRCQNIGKLTESEQREIRAACDKTDYGDAVYEYITTDAESVYICNRYYLSHTLLARKTAQVFRDLARG